MSAALAPSTATRWNMKDGTTVLIRPIRPDDEPMMARFHQTLSEESVYFRYFQLVQLSQRVAHDRLQRQCFVDYTRDTALVVERLNPLTNIREIIAVARMNKLRDLNEAEVAVIVSDAYQKHGLGTQLVGLLIEIASHEKLDRLVASILPENRGMQHVFESLGFQLHYSVEEHVVQAELLVMRDANTQPLRHFTQRPAIQIST